MKVREAEATLREALTADGVPLIDPPKKSRFGLSRSKPPAARPVAGDGLRAWGAFLRFAAVPVDEPNIDIGADGDGCLFDWGTDTSADHGNTFVISLVRQFSFDDDDGEYDHMEQVHCVVLFEAAKFAAVQPGSHWSFETTLSGWATEVEQLPGYTAVASSEPPLAIEVWHEQV